MFTEMKHCRDVEDIEVLLLLLYGVPSSFLQVISTLLSALFSNLSKSASFDGSANYCRGYFFEGEMKALSPVCVCVSAVTEP